VLYLFVFSEVFWLNLLMQCCFMSSTWKLNGCQLFVDMAEVGVQTRNTELDDSKKESNQVIQHGETELEVRANHSNGGDVDETRGRCYSCCVSCKACCKPCMTKHNPLPDSPTRFDVTHFYCCAMLCIARLLPACGVCLSVRLSVTFVSCTKTNKDIFKIFSPCGSQSHSSFSVPNGVVLFQREPP